MIRSNHLPLVSIITPVYNGAKYIERLIESVRTQDYPHIEHLIIDDGSTDGGATVGALQRYPHLRWWSRENRGQYSTMNEGLGSAHGELVCFVSADDMLAPGAVRLVIEFMQIHPDLDGVYGAYAWIDENDVPHRDLNWVHHAPLGFYRYLPFIGHCSLYLKKEKLEQAGLFFESRLRFLGDYDWIVRIIEAKLNIGYVNHFLSFVRTHDEQTTNSLRSEMASERKIVFKRHGANRYLNASVKFMLYGLSAATLMGRAMREAGLKGAIGLVKDWQRRWKARKP
jgi:glycosyltransferase involved in cell wall biosynthesis